MANTSVCNDTSEAVELSEPHGLFLKPVAKINICAQLPQLKTPGKTISNWEVMEKVKHMIRPETFLSVKVVKSTMEFIRLEGEIENKSKLALLTIKLDGKTIKLSGFPESLKVRAAETKVSFPVRHDWDAYFRDAKNMNELRPGERPDTIHLKDLPTRWFASCKDSQRPGAKLRPSEQVVRQVFGTFGEVRSVDIPMLDPYRKEMLGLLAKPGTIQTFNYGQDIQFEAYVQFQEYISFVKAMDALRGMKLMYKEDEDKAHTATIKVDFDRDKHLSDKMIRKRRQECERLEAQEELRQAEARQEKEEADRRKEEERQKQIELEKEKQQKKEEKHRLKEERRKDREEKRRQKRVEKKQRVEEERMRIKVALEERKLLIAHRKLESLRLLSELFEKVKGDKLKEEVAAQEAELEEERKQVVLAEQRRRLEEEREKAEAQIQKKLQLRQQEVALREKLLKNFKAKEQRDQDKQREELRQKLAGSHRLKSAVIMKKTLSLVMHDRRRDPVVDSVIMKKTISSDKHNRRHDPVVDSVKSTVVMKKTQSSDKHDRWHDPSVDPLKSTVIMKKTLSSLKHGRGHDCASSEDRTPPAKEQWGKKKDASDEDDGVKVIDKAKEDKERSVIEILTSSDEEIDPSPKIKKTNSTMDRVLETNRLRAWDTARSRQQDKRHRPQSTPAKPSQKKSRIIIVKQVLEEEDKRKEESGSDSDDSTTTVVPPPRSSFAPHDDPANFVPPPTYPFPPWGAYPLPGMFPPPWGGLPPPGFSPPPRFGPRGRTSRPRRGRAPDPSFHSFKEPYLRKYNTSGRRRSSGDDPAPVSRSSSLSQSTSVSHGLSRTLCKKKDGDGRYMFPLS